MKYQMAVSRRLQKLHLIGQIRDLLTRRTADGKSKKPMKNGQDDQRDSGSQVMILLMRAGFLQAGQRILH
jgi:hypothetical protein